MTMTTNNSSKNPGQTNKRKSPSSPKTNDRTSNQRISTHHHHNHRRPRSGSSSLPTTPTSSSQEHRRPLTKQQQQQPLPLSSEPRLSIADRFMSPHFSNTSTPFTSTTTALSNSALSNSALSNSVLSNSELSDVQTTTSSSNNNLSVADRFMSSPTTLTISSRNNNQQQRHSSPIDPVPGKLTIANAFMRHTAQGRSRAQSVGEMDLGVRTTNQKDSKITPSSNSTTTGASSTINRIHPLDFTQRSTTSDIFFDNENINLDLSLPILSGERRRQFGSQETLVQKNEGGKNKNKKKIPIYAQFIESEKDTILSSQSISNEDERYSFLMDDYYSDQGHHCERRDTAITIVASEEEEEDRFKKYNNNDHLSEKWQYDHDETYDVEEIRYKSKQPDDDDDIKTNGFWIGCCFITCGKRPSQKILERKKKERRSRKRRGTESEEQLYNNENRKKNTNKEEEDKKKKKKRLCCCGRRGWVFSIFLGVILTALIIYFIFPRTPLMRIEGAKLVTPAKITQTKQGNAAMITNVAFESQWLVNITVDNRQNHVPTRLTKIQVLAKDALTGLVIGKGLQNDGNEGEQFILAPNSISTIQLPIHVDYQARDSTDTTFVDLTKSCTSMVATTHEALSLHFWITLHFFGLDWLGYKPTLIATPATGGFACPLS